jgi:hypothetical protein
MLFNVLLAYANYDA